jgi:hypothetical protein
MYASELPEEFGPANIRLDEAGNECPYGIH